MTDHTALFSALVRAHTDRTANRVTSPTAKPDKVPGHEDFISEARMIYGHIRELRAFLLEIRHVYLSTSMRNQPLSKAQTLLHGNSYMEQAMKNKSSIKYLTDKQRDEIDFEAKMIIQQSVRRVRKLEQLEALRLKKLESASTISKFMRDSKQENISQTLALHRKGVTQFLNQKLKEVSEIQTEQQEIRLLRQKEKTMSALDKLPKNANRYISSSAPDEEKRLMSTIGPEMLQELQIENNNLLEEFESTLDKAREAEKALYEISSLQSELTAHLLSQSELTHQLYDDAVQSNLDVANANTQLQNARKKNRMASRLIIFLALFASFFLLFVDYMS
ncbi:uncharacterized protein V1510DRAFT_410359 [Dipodascopsis tothii]|uniref:uncharacterized protein n=1 Tax=Dipodascopsis tothii TaxID=44089 RepID=UPI0034CDEF73